MASFISMTDLIYPVGSVYFSSNSTSPGSRFGGSWTSLADDRFLRICNWFGTGGNGGNHAHTYGIGLYTSAAALVGGSGNNLYALSYSSNGSSAWNPTTLVSQYKTGVVNNSMQDTTKSHSGQMANVSAVTSYSSVEPYYRAVYGWYRTS